MPVQSRELADYLAAERPEPDAVLAEMEAHAARDGIPVVEPPTGALLEILARAAGARRVVEVGTAIGVSTLHLARALPAGGRIVTFEIDPGRQAAARDYLGRAGVLDRVELRLQDATEGIRTLEGPLDLAFVDGTKADYATQVEILMGLLRPGGLLVVDNALMGGTVAADRSDGHWTEEQIAGQRELNRRLLRHADLVASVLPVGDGVVVAVRR